MKLTKYRSAMITGMAALMAMAPHGEALAAKKAGGAPTVGRDFGDIGQNIAFSMERMPGILTGLSYMFALLLGAQAIVKMKEHVENPLQTSLRIPAIKFLAGGMLLALPITYESMSQTIGTTDYVVAAAELNVAEFKVDPFTPGKSSPPGKVIATK